MIDPVARLEQRRLNATEKMRAKSHQRWISLTDEQRKMIYNRDRVSARKRRAQDRDILGDRYIKKALCWWGDVPRDVIKAKRAQMALRRATRGSATVTNSMLIEARILISELGKLINRIKHA